MHINCVFCGDSKFRHGYYRDYPTDKSVIWLTHEQYEDGESIGFIGVSRRCDCNPAADVAGKLRRAKMPPKYQNQDFDTKKYKSQDHAIRVLYDAIQSTVSNAKTLSFVKGVCLYGPAGTGKTSLLCRSMQNIAKQSNLELLFIDFREHMEHIKKNISAEEKDAYIDDFKSIPILFIDDLSAGRQSQFEIDYIETIINYRYNNALPLFCSTNLSHEEMFGVNSVLGHRSISRLQELCIFIRVEGEDIRKEHKKIIPFKRT